MSPQRPTAVTVMAILNIIFGSLGLLCYICGGVGIFIVASAANAAPRDEVGRIVAITWEIMKSIPGYIPVAIVQLVLGLVLTIMLLISGIGMLGLKPWARTTSLVYAVITILANVAHLVYYFALVSPAQADLERRLMPQGFQQGGPFGGGQAMNHLSALIGALISIVYAVVLLVILLNPRVAAAFSGAGDLDYRRPEDDDDQYGFRRKEPPPLDDSYR